MAKKKAATKTKSTTKKEKGGGVVRVNLEGVEAGGGNRSAKVPEDDYPVTVLKAVRGKSARKGTKQISVTMVINAGKYKGKKLIHVMYLTPGALWNLRNFCDAIGQKVKSKGSTDLNLTKWKGKKLGVTVEHEPYEDDDGNEKVSIKINDTFPASQMKGRAIKSKGVELDDDEETDDEDEDEDEAEDEEDDEEEDEDEEEDDEEDEEDDDVEDLDLDDV